MPGAGVLLDAVRGLPGAALLAPPHVSLGYPWLPAAEAQARVKDVLAAAAAEPAFAVELTGPHRYAPDARGRVLVHARPVDDGPFRRLAAVLGGDLRDVHLSLARVLPDGDVGAVEAALAPLLPLRTRVAVLELTAQRERRWSRLVAAPLGVAG